MSVRISPWWPSAILGALVLRLWIMPLPSSFWTDETGTAFIVHHGARAWAGVPWSIYYVLPRLAESIGGFSEVTYRIPSLLAMGMALWTIARLAARLIHPDAAWLAAFACLILRGFDFQAADARPYALGTCAASLAMWFLVRWLDTGRWRNAILFVLFAALLWPIQPVYAPFYLVFAIYAVTRKGAVSWMQIAGVFALLAAALTPGIVQIPALAGNASTHVISEVPGPRELIYSLQLGLVLGCAAAAWLLALVVRQSGATLTRSALLLIALWWLLDPLFLFAFSRMTGISLFVPRYYSLALPGAALAASALAYRFLPANRMKPAAVVLGLIALATLGNWRTLWPPHANMDWRGAAAAINRAAPDASTPIICPSPFIEAQAPTPLPSILYAPLDVYPIRGRIYPFPFRSSPEADRIAAVLPASATRFFIYGHKINAPLWENWYRNRLSGWTSRRLGSFGDVVLIQFDR